jgi:hypothetical protein
MLSQDLEDTRYLLERNRNAMICATTMPELFELSGIERLRRIEREETARLASLQLELASREELRRNRLRELRPPDPHLPRRTPFKDAGNFDSYWGSSGAYDEEPPEDIPEDPPVVDMDHNDNRIVPTNVVYHPRVIPNNDPNLIQNDDPHVIRNDASGTFGRHPKRRRKRIVLVKRRRRRSSKRESKSPSRRSTDRYADVANKKYPIDTPSRVRAAWNFIHQRRNQSKYDRSEVAEMEERIADAWCRLIDPTGPPCNRKR